MQIQTLSIASGYLLYHLQSALLALKFDPQTVTCQAIRCQ